MGNLGNAGPTRPGLAAQRAAWRMLLLTVLIAATGPGAEHPWAFGAALAQDDDGGGDGGGDDDGGDDDGGDDGDDDGGDDDSDDDDDDDDSPRAAERAGRDDGGADRAGRAAQRRQTQRAPAPAPVFERDEIVVTNLAEADLAALQAEGFALIERVDLDSVAVVLHRLQAPAGLTLDQSRDRVRARPTGGTADFNHFYRAGQDSVNPASAPPAPTAAPPTAAPPTTAPPTTAPPTTAPEATLPAATLPLPANPLLQPVALAPPAACTHLNCAALGLIAWPAARAAAPGCRVTVPVGVIDTGVNARHETLAGADLEVVRLVAEEVDPATAVHGTAVAGLLVGQPSARVPGLIPEARVIAVDIFGREGGDERASVASLVRALDLMAQRGVRVINLSLAGPPNAALEAALAQLTGPGGAVVLAAAGNGGPAAGPAYPAAYPSVLAVTAVDQRGQIYRRAQRGAHLDFAAPGVEVWSATSIRGVKPKTGTSFAVPFATAVAAVLTSQDPAAAPGVIADRMRALVRDLGAAGPDEIYGAGLLALDGLCTPQISAAGVE